MNVQLPITPDYITKAATKPPVGKRFHLDKGLLKTHYQQQFDQLLDGFYRQLDQRFGKLMATLESKLENRGDLLQDVDTEVIKMSFAWLATWVLPTNPQKTSVDVTENSVFLTALYGNRNAYLELFFEPGKEEPEELVFNIYENKKPVSAYGGKFASALAAFLKQMPIEIPLR